MPLSCQFGKISLHIRASLKHNLPGLSTSLGVSKLLSHWRSGNRTMMGSTSLPGPWFADMDALGPCKSHLLTQPIFLRDSFSSSFVGPGQVKMSSLPCRGAGGIGSGQHYLQEGSSQLSSLELSSPFHRYRPSFSTFSVGQTITSRDQGHAMAVQPASSSSMPAVELPDSRNNGTTHQGDRRAERLRLESSNLQEVAAPVVATSSGGFSTLGLSPELLRRLEAVGLETATDVQTTAIPTLLQGRDAAVQSYTGSGKTLAYLLPVLSKVGPLAEASDSAPAGKQASGILAVIVAPSRELAMQIVREAERILGPENKKAVQQLIGGANQLRQEEALKKLKPLIVVGTPGRLSDLSKAGRLQTHGCQWLVLDEADSLLSHKFRLDMLRILEHVGLRRVEATSPAGSGSAKPTTRKERQTVLVSATMPPAVLEAACKWGHRPLLVQAGGIAAVAAPGSAGPGQASASPGGTRAGVEGLRESLPPNLDHRYVTAPQRHRVDVVRKCIHALAAKSVIVFMNYGRRLKDTEFKLGARSIAAGNLHGGMDKVARANVLSAFRDGKLRVLVVSEVAARGLDVLECDLVVNLEMPTDGAHYAHRAGRTGRLGRGGTVITICEEGEAFVVSKFARSLGIKIDRAEVVEGQLLPYEGRMKY